MKPVKNTSADTPPQWEALVSRAVDEAPAQDAAALATARKAWHRRVAWTLILMVLSAAAGLAFQQWTQAPPPSADELDKGRRALLMLVNSSLEQHLRMHGEYPEDLTTVLPIQMEVGYRRTADGYEASVRLSDGRLVNVKRP